MTPTELRTHAACCLAIADVLEQLADLHPLRARAFATPPHQPSFILEWDVPNEGGDVSVMVTADSQSAECSFHSSYVECGPDEYVTLPLTDIAAICAFVRAHVGAKP